MERREKCTDRRRETTKELLEGAAASGSVEGTDLEPEGEFRN